MEITLEMIDAVRERTGADYAEAKEALEKSGGSVVDAIVLLEKKSRINTDEIIGKIKALVKEGNVNKIRVKRGEQVLLTVPVNVGILGGLLVFGQVPDHYADHAPKGWFDKKLVAVAKNAAYANACKAADCDSLVGTRYEIKYNDYFVWQKVLVTVKGYPAKLTGVEFHKANLDCPCAKK